LWLAPLGTGHCWPANIEPGDLIQIDGNYRGRVIASMDTNKYLPSEDSWSYLGVGIMVDTNFGGLVHYTTETAEDFVLIEHKSAA
jgi:hypothetical protein